MNLSMNCEPDFDTCTKFPYERLTTEANDLPDGVDVAHREVCCCCFYQH